MLLLRLFGLLAALAIAVSTALYFFTGEGRYLRTAYRIARYAIGAALVIFALLALERLVALI